MMEVSITLPATGDRATISVGLDETVGDLKQHVANRFNLGDNAVKRMQVNVKGGRARLPSDSTQLSQAGFRRGDVVEVHLSESPVLCPHDYAGHSGPVLHVAVSPCGTRLYTSSEDSTLRAWDTQSGRCVKVLPCREHSSSAQLSRQLAVSPKSDRVYLITPAAVDGWDTTTWRHFQADIESVSAHALSPAGDTLYMSLRSQPMICVLNTATWAVQEKKIRRRDTPVMQQITEEQRSLLALAVSTCGKRLYGAGEFKGLIVWDTDTWRPIMEVPTDEWVLRLAVSPCGGFIYSSPLWYGKVHMWEEFSLRHVAEFDCGQLPDMSRNLTSANNTVVSDVAVSPCGRMLYCLGHGIAVWDTKSRSFRGMLVRRGQGGSLAVWSDCVFHNTSGRAAVTDSHSLEDANSLRFDWVNTKKKPTTTGDKDGCGAVCTIS